MPNIIPAGNVQAAIIAGFFSVIIEHVSKAHGYELPEDISASLPAVMTIIVAHVWDMITGGNKKPASPISGNENAT